MRRGFVLVVALAALVLPSGAAAYTETRALMPGVSYTREVTWRSAGPLVLHILRGPRPGGLYALKPVLSNNLVTGRETLSAMQRRVSRNATVAGVNGDFFNLRTGHPSGIVMRDNVLLARPQLRRSSLAIDAGGSLHVARIKFGGSWQIEGFATHPLFDFNRPLVRRGVALFTPTWGARTPRTPRVVEVVLAGVGKVRPARRLETVVVKKRRGGGRPIPPGGAVLQARGAWKDIILAEARAGRPLAIEIGLTPWWDGAGNAIGGGPLLVQDGVPVTDPAEEFSTYQLAPRHPRTAVGQLADGRVILVTADGRWRGSIGLRNAGLAREMARLGAVTAMALDGGGSSTMAFDGSVLNRPSDGAQRAVSNGLMLFYYGVYAPRPRHGSFSPNGDGVADVQRLRAKLVRRSDVVLELVRPDGTVRWRYRALRAPGTIRKSFSSPSAMEGTWRWVVSATDARGRESQMTRRFTVNKTLGHLELSKERMRVVKRRGGRLVASFRVTNPARLSVVVRRGGTAVRRLYANGDVKPGRYAIVWDGRRSDGRVARTGTYTIRVQARNGLGTARLAEKVFVRRVAAAP